MWGDKIYSPLGDFDFKILDDPEFKEDAVREEIVTPVLKALGYAASGSNRIIRSRKLLHPFVSIGSARKEIFIIPDYLLEIDGRHGWIMEAKSPSEEILKSVHVEQAYSYAIHSEVRVNYFALCNGKKFALYDTGKIEPVFNFPIQMITHYWNDLKKRLLPENVFIPEHPFAKDLGLHLKRLGFTDFEAIIFPKVLPMFIARLNENLFTFSSAGIMSDTEKYATSFDFDLETAKQLRGMIPEEGFNILMQPFKGVIQKITFDRHLYLDVAAKIGQNLEENDKEIFLPLIVTGFLKNIEPHKIHKSWLPQSS